MKKLVFALAAVFLVCAVICTAGCTTTTSGTQVSLSDTVAGQWYTKAIDGSAYQLFNIEKNGAAYFDKFTLENGQAVSIDKVLATVTPNADGSYTIVQETGDSTTFTISEDGAILTITKNGSTYSKNKNAVLV